MRLAALLAAVVLLGARAAMAGPVPDLVTAPSFGAVPVYVPEGTPRQVVLFISGDGGWSESVVDMAERLRDEGALVVGIDIRTFRKSLDNGSSCAYPAGPLEALSRFVQLRYKLPVYKPPILAGHSSGAALVYAVLAAAPPQVFAGGLSLAFCTDVEIHRPLCDVGGLDTVKQEGPYFRMKPFERMKAPWTVLQGERDRVCRAPEARAFVAKAGEAARYVELPRVGHGFGVPGDWTPQLVDAYQAIAAASAQPAATAVPTPVRAPAAAPAAGLSAADEAALADLSVAEVPARPGTAQS